MEKMTQIKALTIAIEALEANENLVSNEIIEKLKDVAAAIAKKNGRTSKKATAAKEEKFEEIKNYFTTEPVTLTDILKANRTAFDELGITSSQGLLGAIRVGLDTGEIIREKNGKTTTFRLAE